MSFERHLAIDWSGAGGDGKRNRGLAVATSNRGSRSIVSPPRFTTWTRFELEAWLCDQLTPGAPRTLVAVDASLSYPDGFQYAMFGVRTWGEMVSAFASAARPDSTAREVARALNAQASGGGPFRFDESRNDGSWYRTHDVGYFRAVDLLVPQVISPFYLGSGATVGYHTITCLRSLHRLIRRRDASEIAFTVWPHEGLELPPHGHVIVECYPSSYPHVAFAGATTDELDALRTVAWMDVEAASGRLIDHLRVREPVAGRRKGRDWREQMQFEGWVMGA